MIKALFCLVLGVGFLFLNGPVTGVNEGRPWRWSNGPGFTEAAGEDTPLLLDETEGPGQDEGLSEERPDPPDRAEVIRRRVRAFPVIVDLIEPLVYDDEEDGLYYRLHTGELVDLERLDEDRLQALYVQVNQEAARLDAERVQRMVQQIQQQQRLIQQIRTQQLHRVPQQPPRVPQQPPRAPQRPPSPPPSPPRQQR